jgi:menaquinone-dependent protoporphyrinogen oxidase
MIMIVSTKDKRMDNGMEKILVTYASVHGSTQEVAEVIASVIREQGFIADLQAARNIRALSGYSAVVLGAPLYMFRLHRDAVRFLKKHQKELKGGLPIAIFAGGPFGESKAEDWQGVRENLNRELAKFTWLRPFSIELIGGRFDPTHLRFPWNLIPAMKQMPPSDLRDWGAIRTWAGSLVGKIDLPISQAA